MERHVQRTNQRLHTWTPETFSHRAIHVPQTPTWDLRRRNNGRYCRLRQRNRVHPRLQNRFNKTKWNLIRLPPTSTHLRIPSYPLFRTQSVSNRTTIRNTSNQNTALSPLLFHRTIHRRKLSYNNRPTPTNRRICRLLEQKPRPTLPVSSRSSVKTSTKKETSIPKGLT